MAAERPRGVPPQRLPRQQPGPQPVQASLELGAPSPLPPDAVEILAGLPLGEPAGSWSAAHVAVCSACSWAWLG